MKPERYFFNAGAQLAAPAFLGIPNEPVLLRENDSTLNNSGRTCSENIPEILGQKWLTGATMNPMEVMWTILQV